jgi:flagellar protein FliL
MMADSKAAAPVAPAKDMPGAVKGKDAAAAAGKAANASPAKKRNLKPVILIAAAVLLLASGGAAAYLLLFKSDSAESTAPAAAKGKGADGEKADKDKKAESKKPYFVEFDTFTVNMKDPDKFLQIKLTFQVKSVDAAETLKEMMPIVRSAVIPVLGAQDPSELMAAEGKEKLSHELVLAANKSVAGSAADQAIDAVLITHMLIQ